MILDSIKEGLHQYLDARIVITSTVPISVVAHSEDVTGARDSFLGTIYSDMAAVVTIKFRVRSGTVIGVFFRALFWIIVNHAYEHDSP